MKMFLSLGALLVVSACDAGSGQLAQAPIELACGPEEVECQQRVFFAPLAVGASMPFSLAPEVAGSTGLPIALESVDESIATVQSGQLQATGEGVTAVLARIPDGSVVDLTHIWTEKAERLSMHRVTDDAGQIVDARELDEQLDTITGDVSMNFTFKLWGKSRELLGDAHETWTLTTDDDFILMNQGDERKRRLLLPETAPASATLTVEALGFQQTIQIEVVR